MAVHRVLQDGLRPRQLGALAAEAKHPVLQLGLALGGIGMGSPRCFKNGGISVCWTALAALMRACPKGLRADMSPGAVKQYEAT